MPRGNILKVSRKLLNNSLKLLEKNVYPSSTATTWRHCHLCTYHRKLFSQQLNQNCVENNAKHSCFYSFVTTHKSQAIPCIVSHSHVDENRNFHSVNKQSDPPKHRNAAEYNPVLFVGGPPARHLSLTAKGILDASPLSIQPYLRLIRFDKPIGTWLLYWPCTWSIAMAADAGHLPDLKMLLLFGAGAFVMRGAGCIINDMWDKDFDKKVARTSLRPLATGEITPFQALVFLSSQLSLALAILLQLNYYSIILGASSMILVVLYPLAKRFTYWPQLILGVTLNWGILLAWSDLTGSLDWSIVPLYTGCVLYTMFYDTIYSHQDKYDDMLIGVKSTALRFGDQTKPWLSAFASITVAGFAVTGYMCDQTWPYYLGVSATATHLAYQLYTVNLNDADDCASKFFSNTRLGLIMFLGTVFGTLLKESKLTENQEKAS